MAKRAKPKHALNHGGMKRKYNPKRKAGKVGLVNEKENMTALRWQTVIEATAHGADLRGAAKKAKISVRTIDSFLISNVAAAGQLRDAKMLWNRREWPMEQIEEVLQHVALGKTVRQAFDAAGVERKLLAPLYKILLKDKARLESWQPSRWPTRSWTYQTSGRMIAMRTRRLTMK